MRQLILLLLFLCGCQTVSHTPHPAEFTFQQMRQSDYYIVFLVDAPHLDYQENHALLRTIAKHPSNGSKNGDVGHAWVYLHGCIDGYPVFIEGGQSGERGITQARYFEGVMNGIEYGAANPTSDQMNTPAYEPNPIKYLWEAQQDGFFQQGAGNHTPTYAAKIDLTPEQFHRILEFIQSYSYEGYSLTEHQCTTFVATIGALIDFPLHCDITIDIDQTLELGGVCYQLWEDPRYAKLTFASPDALEACLRQAVHSCKAEYALPWYLNTHRYRPNPWDALRLLPMQSARAIHFH